MMDFSKILAPISEQMETFEAELREVLQADSQIVTEITDYLYSGAGKRLRPALLFLSAGNVNYRAMQSALAVELIHTATLLHDDVIDESHTRRGMQTVNSKWNNMVAVLMGDYLFAKSFNLLVKADLPDLMTSFSKATERVSVGELNQAFHTGDFNIAEKTYIGIIADKTASLFACSAEAGAICSGRDNRTCQALRDYGEYVGLAFQIADDLLDLTGEAKKLGKSLGSDIRGGWITLPLIEAFKNDGDGSRERLKYMLSSRKVSDSDIGEIARFASEKGGILYAQQKASSYVQKAIDALKSLDELPMKSALVELAQTAAVRDR